MRSASAVRWSRSAVQGGERGERRGAESGKGDDREAERDALLDHVQDLLERIRGLEAACACLERDRGKSSSMAEGFRKEASGLKQDLDDALGAAQERREEIAQREQKIKQMQGELDGLQQTGEAERAEKEEMCRLYNELLKQLKAAEGQKEELQFQARQAAKREECEGQEANSLREQLDQCLRRLSDAQHGAAERARLAEDKSMALQNTLSGANSRLAKLDSLEIEVASRAAEIQDCRRKAQEQESALSSAISRLAKLDALEADVKARTAELKKLQREKQESDANLAKERSRTQHLVGAFRDMEDESAILSSRERDALSQAEVVKQELEERGSKVSELSLVCEELQKRIVRLQSGAEMQASRQQVAEAFALAERQDELLGDASVRLEHLQSEARHLGEELARNRESFEVAKSILMPVLMGARCQLGLRPGGHAHGPTTKMTAANQSHSRESGGQPQDDSEMISSDADLRSGDIEEGDEEELLEMEDLAREAAELLLHVLASVGPGISNHVGEATDRPLHRSELSASLPRCVGQGGKPRDVFSQHHCRWSMDTDEAGGENDNGEAQTSSFCGRKAAAVNFDNSTTVGDAGRHRRKNGVSGSPAVSMPSRDTLRRMESIRRGQDGDGRAVLVNGVKAKRRGHLQGGKPRSPPTSIVDSWMRASLQSTRPHAFDEQDEVAANAFARSRACGTTGTNFDVGSRWRKPPLGSYSPGAQQIRQRIHDAQATLRSLRSTTT
ncbi:unnamed protein product [Scytosiphon promiscuus]